ncbi:MAG TPA: LPS assembly protein LptD [Acidobacteriaceae bacterium]|jgi:LPS-assembly protein|nr:LPS assembly protein LptD [Acidobacteriaceae bacterium]
MRARICIFITLFALCHLQTPAYALAGQLPGQAAFSGTPSVQRGTATQSISADASSNLPDAPDAAQVPIAQVVVQSPVGTPVTMHAQQQEKQGDIYNLRGEVEIDYKDYVLRADRITYNAATGDVRAQGHVQLDGGPDNEEISATHGDMNLNAQTGRFYDVLGSVGVLHGSGQRAVYTTPNPFLISGKLLVKSGPDSYVLYGGSMTSCRLPKPDWRILAPHITVANGTAKAWNANFRLLRYPIFYLPYVTHSVDSSGRQSGFLIPYLSNSSIKGKIVGTAYYWAINRSSDLLVAVQYYSLRGWAESAEYRYRGRGNDFVRGHYDGLFDCAAYHESSSCVNQGGQDTVLVGRRDLDTNTHAVINAEYLSSYVYRLVFTPNFSQAISSEVKSWAFLTHQQNGLSASADLERYQNFESDTSGDEVRILHLPRLDFDTTDHSFGNSRVFWGGQTSFSMLSRSEPGLATRLAAARTDIFPHLIMPLVEDGWTIRPELGLRETFYSDSQTLTPTTPIQRHASLNRKAVEAGVEVLPPVLERDYDGDFLAHRFGVAIRHTIAPELQYHYVAGIGNFNDVERFDSLDIYSNTNELEYGLTQRWYIKPLKPHVCKPDEIPTETTDAGSAVVQHKKSVKQEQKTCVGGTQEWLSWYVAQKYFFDPTFGGAVVPGRRNIFTGTLDFSAIAYITSPRNVSPVISRLRLRTSGSTDMEWDLDYDTKAGRIAANNIFANYRHGSFFSSFGYALMNAPGESTVAPGLPSQVTNYNQTQGLLGYGAPTKLGLSAAADGGYDLKQNSLEYAGVQTSYNFNCCGFSVEYRRYRLGTIRDEGQESFSITLAGVGSAGNLKRAERLF